MKTSAVNMKEQFKMNPIGSEVSSIKKGKSALSKLWLIWFFTGTATASLIMVIIFWHTNVFRDAILARLELKNGTQSFSWWERPPVSPLLKIRIFNYTNIEDYKLGKAPKLQTEEVGPWIYTETIVRENVRINANGTISYQERRTHELVGDRSDDELIYVPNVPLIMVVKMINDINYLLHPAATTTLSLMGAEPFKLITVKEYLWGYNDNLINAGRDIMSFTGSAPYEKFGMLMARTGLSEDVITIHSGTNDINNLGRFENINGLETRNVWKDKECDKVEGTDGSLFPPNLIEDHNSTLTIYIRDMQRKFPMRFQEYGSSFGIPTLRYRPVEDIFTATNTTNSCFCKKNEDDEVRKIDTCPPVGTFDMSVCSFGAPLLISFPHFYKGEKSLLDNVEGLNPRRNLHETYMDVHPRLGVVIGGWSRLQINAHISVAESISALKPLKDDMILPILWFEIGVDEMPETVLITLKQAYFTANTLESILQWGSLLCTIISMCATAVMLKRQREFERPKWQNNVSLKVGC